MVKVNQRQSGPVIRPSYRKNTSISIIKRRIVHQFMRKINVDLLVACGIYYYHKII